MTPIRIEKVVDTTGAGDQYAAGFLHALAQGRVRLDQCGRLGNLAASEVIAHYGPRPQVSLKDLAAGRTLGPAYRERATNGRQS